MSQVIVACLAIFRTDRIFGINAVQRRFAYRQIEGGGQCGKCHIRVPHPAKVAKMADRQSPEVRSEKTADLMGQHGEAKQRGQIANAEQLANQGRCRRYGRQPGKAEARRKQVKGDLGSWHQQVKGDQ